MSSQGSIIGRNQEPPNIQAVTTFLLKGTISAYTLEMGVGARVSEIRFANMGSVFTTGMSSGEWGTAGDEILRNRGIVVLNIVN